MGPSSLINEMVRVNDIGCDIHTVLQKQDKNGIWYTVDTGILDDRNYELFGFLSNVRCMMPMSWDGAAKDGHPTDFTIDSSNNHLYQHITEGDLEYYMGSHSFGTINLEDFITTEYPYPKFEFTDKMMIEKLPQGFMVEFMDDEHDDGQCIRNLQAGLRSIFGYSGEYEINGKVVKYGAQLYRLVIGYDS